MNIADTISTIRRRIGDNDSSSYIYEDSDLIGYIEDSISSLNLDINIVSDEYSVVISKDLSFIIALKSIILIKYTEKISADRDNFLLRKGRLTVDNTNQSSDHGETIKMLEDELKSKMYYYGEIGGVRVE